MYEYFLIRRAKKMLLDYKYWEIDKLLETQVPELRLISMHEFVVVLAMNMVNVC